MKYLKIIVLSLLPVIAWGQDYTIKVAEENIVMDLKGKAKIEAVVVDKDGKEVEDANIAYFSRSRRSLTVDGNGNLEAMASGEFSIILMYRPNGGNRIRKDIAVQVKFPPIKSVEFVQVPQKVYEGTKIKLNLKVTDQADVERPKRRVTLSSSDNNIAQVDSQ